VTFNFDMVLTACELGTRFIWFDQRKRSPNRMETALIFLRRWDEWEQEVADGSVVCLKVGRGSKERLTVDQARQRAERRFKSSQKSKGDAKVRANRRRQEILHLDFSNDE